MDQISHSSEASPSTTDGAAGWTVIFNNNTLGPLSHEQFLQGAKDGHVTPESMVSHPQWTQGNLIPSAQVPGFWDSVNGQVQSPAPVAQQPAPEQALTDAHAQPPVSSSSPPPMMDNSISTPPPMTEEPASVDVAQTMFASDAPLDSTPAQVDPYAPVEPAAPEMGLNAEPAPGMAPATGLAPAPEKKSNGTLKKVLIILGILAAIGIALLVIGGIVVKQFFTSALEGIGDDINQAIEAEAGSLPTGTFDLGGSGSVFDDELPIKPIPVNTAEATLDGVSASLTHTAIGGDGKGGMYVYFFENAPSAELLEKCKNEDAFKILNDITDQKAFAVGFDLPEDGSDDLAASAKKSTVDYFSNFKEDDKLKIISHGGRERIRGIALSKTPEGKQRLTGKMSEVSEFFKTEVHANIDIEFD